jgi:uncharacterized protein
LDFALEKVSIPVGRIDFLTLFPLTFHEFLCATQREILVRSMPKLTEWELKPNKYTDAAGTALYEALREYTVVGGMPECVASFVAHRSFERVSKIQKSLIETFEADVLKYKRGNLQISNIQSTWTKVAKRVGSEITYTTINPEDNHKPTKNSLILI